jgi:hypothetical protein
MRKITGLQLLVDKHQLLAFIGVVQVYQTATKVPELQRVIC